MLSGMYDWHCSGLKRACRLQAGMAWAILSEWGWRWLGGVSSVPLLLLLLLYPLLPESPYWLLATKWTQKAQVLLQQIGAVFQSTT